MIADLRVTFQMELDLKILRMDRLHIPQERMAKRLGILQQTISRHLSKMPELAKWVNSYLKRGFTVPQVAEKHGNIGVTPNHKSISPLLIMISFCDFESFLIFCSIFNADDLLPIFF